MDRFELEGVTYYQQTRKCGKQSCHCATGKKPHGPYWYRRDQVRARVDYVGKQLPPEIAAARFAHDHLLPEMVTKRRELLRQHDALNRLIRNKTLRPGDREIIKALGFGQALVSEMVVVGAQER